jgi:hypothetical protein
MDIVNMWSEVRAIYPSEGMSENVVMWEGACLGDEASYRN